MFSDEVYDSIYLADDFDMDEYFFSYKLRRALEYLRSEFAEEYGFIRDAELTSLSLLSRFGSIKKYGSLSKDAGQDYATLKSDYSKILEATRVVVDEEIELKGERFEKRRFFIAPATLGRILEQLLKTEKLQ